MPAVANRLRAAKRDLMGVLHNADLRRLELAWALSIVSSWAYSIAVVVYAFDAGGATAVGVVGLLRWVAAGLVSPFAALLADRYDRRQVMVASDLLRAALIGAAAVAVLSDTGAPVVYLLATLVSVAGTPFRPAEAAYTPELVETPDELGAANVVAAAIESVGIFAGPALGGLLLAWTSVSTTFLVTAAGVALSAVLILGIHRRHSTVEEAAEAGGVRAELVAGVRAVFADRKVSLLVGLFAAQTFVDGLLGVLIAVVALDYLAGGAATVGWLNAATGVGGVLGAGVAGVLVGRGRLATDFGIGVVLFGVPLALVAGWKSEALALGLLGVIGIGNTVADVSGVTLLQRVTPAAVVGRVFGLLESVLLLTVGLGAIAAPALVSALGIRPALVVSGLLLPLLVVPSMGVLRRIDDAASVPRAEIELLQGVPFLATLPEVAVERLARSAQRSEAAAGKAVVTQGERGDRFYVVESGELDVSVDGAAVSTLKAGDYFGEIALLRDVPRTATVRARRDSSLLALERHEFLGAVALLDGRDVGPK